MRVSDVLQTESSVFLKSEFAPISNYWPAVSFTLSKAENLIRKSYVAGRDLVLYTGTLNPENTRAPEHRGRLLSLIRIDKTKVHDTWNVIPEASWDETRNMHTGRRWLRSFIPIEAWNFVSFPLSRTCLPISYPRLRDRSTMGTFNPITQDEIEGLGHLEIELVHLKLLAPRDPLTALSQETNKKILQMAYKVAEWMEGREDLYGTETRRYHAVKSMAPALDKQGLAVQLWNGLGGCCYLCRQPIPLDYTPGPFCWSPDRIDSSLGYIEGNVSLAHRACNLAKNQWGEAEFNEWFRVASMRFQPTTNRTTAIEDLDRS